MRYSIEEITGHPFYSHRKGRVWAVVDTQTGRFVATASSRTQAKVYRAEKLLKEKENEHGS